MMQNPEVLIIGAGPTGLMMANQMERYGISYRIIDRKSGRSKYSKALVIHSRTLEMMGLLGMSESFVKKSFITPSLHFYYERKKLFEISLSHLRHQTKFPFLSIMPQSETEKLLEEELAKGLVEWKTELIDFTQTVDRVEAVIKSGDTEEKVAAKYVIGCDGARSTVRHFLGMPFEGKSENVHVMLGDVEIDDQELSGNPHLFTTERGLQFFAPFQDKYTRVIAIDFKKQGDHFPKEVTMEELRDTVDKIYPGTLNLENPYWLSAFSASHRHVPAYQDNRVFLAGDAAHIHNPLGGQGMNVGLQDAANLAWKIAYVLKYNLPSALLHSYHEERWPVAEEVIQRTNLLLKGMSLQNRKLISLRNKALKLLFRSAAVQKKIVENLSQLNVNYPPAFAKKKGNISGMRVPDVSLYNLTKKETNLYSYLQSGECLLLIYTEETALPKMMEQVNRSIHSFREKAGPFLMPLFVVPNDLSGNREDSGRVLIDGKGEMKQTFGLQTGDLIVIRPDAYTLIHTNKGHTAMKSLIDYLRN
ncbi:FAD-dependent monooxygenase [Halobacillus massiliensis]|uniref:FAD-dependent monooxygenase n=1 Tax=Halobacillus massiliensis TaxID=1926286 RepID=UPI0009E56583|nr:FAD-dependent monooxygenase [Halobacillus massiliensis]